MQDRVVDRELDDEKDVVWGQAQRKKKTKASLKYDSLLAKNAPRYNAAESKEKRPIAEEMVASLGLSFVHLKDGRVCKELGKDKVVSRTMKELREEARKSKSQARLPNEPPTPSNAGGTAIIPSNAGETAITHSAPSNTGVTWDETAMQALANPQRPVTFTNVTGGYKQITGGNHFDGDYKQTVHITNDNSLDLGIIKQQLGDIEGKLDSNRDELRSVNNKVTGLTPAKSLNQGHRWSLSPPPRQPSFGSPPAAAGVPHMNGLSYCEELLSTQDNPELEKLVQEEMEELGEIRIVKTTLGSLPMAKAHLNLQQAAPNLLFIIHEDQEPTGCVYYETNEFVGAFSEGHNVETMVLLQKALGLRHEMTLRVEGEEGDEAQVTMAVDCNSHTHLSSIMTLICEIAIECSSCIDLVGFIGPSGDTKHDLILNASVLGKLLQHFSHLQFQDLRLLDTHLRVMGKATGGANAYKFDRCGFSLEGANFLFVRESPMKLRVLEIPHSSFFADCKGAIKSGVLVSLLITTNSDATKLDLADFWMVVDIQRELAEKGKELFFTRDCDVDIPFNVGFVELPDCSLPSNRTPEAIKKVAKMDPSDYENEKQYKIAAIKIAKSVLQPGQK